MRIAIVHDDLVQWGGAERVLEGICEIYPDATVITSVFDRNNLELTKRFGKRKVITSFLQKIPGWKKLYKALLPLYPIAFEQFNFDEFDLVISHTTRFAKSIITKPNTLHISYCHTPPRFLWHLSGEKEYPFASIFMSKLRIYDAISARRVDLFLAGSKNAQRRIKKIYRRTSKVLYPFVDLKRFNNLESFDGGYFLVISRLNKYKMVDLAIQACGELNLPIKIIGTGPEMENLAAQNLSQRHKKLVFLGKLSDEMVVQVLAGAKALIIPGIEDFGLISLEAQALGKPVIAFKDGGALETVIENKTGLFFDKQSVESLKKALTNFTTKKFNPLDSKENAQLFDKEKFVKDFKQIVDSLVYT